MPAIGHDLLERFAAKLDHSDTILIGSGAGLTAAAGINYLDQKKFAEVFPGWVKKGFHCQYELMGFPFPSQQELWGYYKVHLEYVYFSQGENALYHQLYEQVKKKKTIL